jgi:hypothetical protein
MLDFMDSLPNVSVGKRVNKTVKKLNFSVIYLKIIKMPFGPHYNIFEFRLQKQTKQLHH